MPSARIELPVVDFLYTVDQIAMLLGVPEEVVRAHYLFFDGRSTGTQRGKMRARNIAPDDATPDWRVSGTQFKMYLQRRGFTVIEHRVL